MIRFPTIDNDHVRVSEPSLDTNVNDDIPNEISCLAGVTVVVCLFIGTLVWFSFRES
jgi:hypothetical protein